MDNNIYCNPVYLELFCFIFSKESLGILKNALNNVSTCGILLMYGVRKFRTVFIGQLNMNNII